MADLATAFFAGLPAAFLATGFFFGAGLDTLTAARFFTAFFATAFLAAAFFFGTDAAFFVFDDAFATAFFFLFAIPIPPLRFSAAQRPPSSMNEQALATISIMISTSLRGSHYFGSNRNARTADNEKDRHRQVSRRSTSTLHWRRAMMRSQREHS
uniref:hypothetical protein n=1 Tax=Nitrospira cf. moscoviensis SBR1015 TaxID=96242 RepID=UPI00117CF574|nr:hypothetical protein [Nitrospira cf. moscoviensis SBR1015]